MLSKVCNIRGAAKVALFHPTYSFFTFFAALAFGVQLLRW